MNKINAVPALIAEQWGAPEEWKKSDRWIIGNGEEKLEDW